jgi:hypothetical protein
VLLADIGAIACRWTERHRHSRNWGQPAQPATA